MIGEVAGTAIGRRSRTPSSRWSAPWSCCGCWSTRPASTTGANVGVPRRRSRRRSCRGRAHRRGERAAAPLSTSATSRILPPVVHRRHVGGARRRLADLGLGAARHERQRSAHPDGGAVRRRRRRRPHDVRLLGPVAGARLHRRASARLGRDALRRPRGDAGRGRGRGDRRLGDHRGARLVRRAHRQREQRFAVAPPAVPRRGADDDAGVGHAGERAGGGGVGDDGEDAVPRDDEPRSAHR